MALMILTSEDSGAPVLSGTNGALTAVLRWALVQNGWAVEYGPTGNAAVFRPGSGNRFRLHVNHDSAVSGDAMRCVARGCEDASAASTLIDAFPTVAQVPNANCGWMTSTAASATARRWKILLWEDFFYLLIDINSDGRWEPYFFGDLRESNPADPYATAIACRNTTVTGSSSSARYASSLNTYTVGQASVSTTSVKIYWARDISGAVKSTKGLWGASGSTLGAVGSGGSFPAFAGYGNRVEREKLSAHCMGENTGAGYSMLVQTRRAWFPNIWGGLHTNYPGIASEDTFSDSAYDPTASFLVTPVDTNQYLFVETTETWSKPSD